MCNIFDYLGVVMMWRPFNFCDTRWFQKEGGGGWKGIGLIFKHMYSVTGSFSIKKINDVFL